MTNLLIEIIGWAGTALILLAYFLLTHKKLREESKIYHLMNLFGGLGLILNTLANKAYPSTGLNIVWSVIAIYGVVKGLGLFKKK